MKRKLLVITFCFALFLLASCQSQDASMAENYWKSAGKEDTLKSYVEKQADSIELTTLQQEASSADGTMSQQFYATALLCEIDRQGGADASAYAENFLAKVNTEEDQFWDALDNTSIPYDCFSAIFESANQIDAQTLAKLVSDVPQDSPYPYDDMLLIAVDNWVKSHPSDLLTYVDELKAVGYFDKWNLDEWITTYFYDSGNPYCIETDTTGNAIAYISYMRDSLLPELKEKDRNQLLQTDSKLIDNRYYTTNLTVTVNETLELKEPDQNNLPETIELDGKKVLAFYHNPYAKELKNSPTNLRVLGDFMLGLSADEYPKSTDEADYYLVLTPFYKYDVTDKGYEDRDKMISSTSIDLYEAKTGIFLRNIGYVLEDNFSGEDSETPEYPELLKADVLSFIYHNMNTPDEYASMLVNRYGKKEFQLEEPVSLGGWEITCHSCEISDSFVEGKYIYEPDKGYQFARLKITVKNAGDKKHTFLPMMYYVGSDTLVQITDSSFEDFYDSVNILNLDTCLADTSLEPGESAEGELDIQLPDAFVNKTDTFYISISLGEQNAVFCPVEK